MSSSPYRVSILVEEPHRKALSQRWVRDVIRRALAAEDAPAGGRVEVLIAGDETVSTLNAQFLGQEGTTDVLSFPAEEFDIADDWPTDQGATRGDIGQIVVSAPQIAAQADANGLSVEEEAAHLLVHGILHLLGHDHVLSDDEETMRAREDAILMDVIGRPVHGTEPMALSHADSHEAEAAASTGQVS